MVEIEFMDKLNDDIKELIDYEFDKYAEKNGVKSDYKKFNFVARDGSNIIGVINGHSCYDEIHISDFIVVEEYRNKHIGSMLIKKVEEYFKDTDFENFNLTTYEFQAPRFYENMGYKLEYVRKNSRNSKLNKYFYSKKRR